MRFRKKIVLALLFLCNVNLWAQNVMVEQTFTYLNSGSKTFTVADLKVINLPVGSSSFWYDSFTGGAAIPVRTPLVSGKKYFLETIPKAPIGSRLQTIVYEISPSLTADKPNNVCNGEIIKITANNILSSEQFTAENSNGKGLNLTKVIDFGNSTYYVRPQSMSWENANNLISSIPGASMYIINSTAEESAVYNALRNLGLAGPTNDGNALWLGLKQYSTANNFSDSSTQTGWYWIDGSPLTYSNWGAGEPNDYLGNTGVPPGFFLYDAGSINDEDYVQFDFRSQGITWNDAPNNSSDRNSFPILEFNATNNLQWYKYNYTTNRYDIIPGQTKADLFVTAVTGNQKYRFDMLTNGVSLSLEYEVVATSPEAFPIPINLTTTCDDEIDPLNQDGKANFDTTGFENTIKGTQTNVTVTYVDGNNIPLPTPLPNPFTTSSQTVTAKVAFNSNANCFKTVSIPFVVNARPKIKNNTGGSEDVFICSDAIPLSSTIDAGIFDGTPTSNYTYIWYKNGTPISPSETNPTLNVNSNGLYSVEVKNANGCTSVRTIRFTINPKPQISPIASNLTTTCDDEADPLLQDGKANFDTSTFQSILLGGQTGMTVTYYDQNGNPLPSPLPNPFLSSTQNVSVKIELTSNTSCYVTGVIPLVVNPLPKINSNVDGNDNILICYNQTNINETLNASIADGTPSTNYTYVWSKEGSIINGETNYTFNANSKGNYSVVVTSIATGCKSIRNINITPSELPKIASIDKLELSNINSIKINLVKSGSFVFGIHGENGYFQSSNFFNNLAPGIYEAVVKDINGCGNDKQTVYIIGAPKYFTPNNDGFNDTWNIKGIDALVNGNSIIFIYNRYGKLLKQISPRGSGWDGTHNGFSLPADDYWFTLKLEDGRNVKGHFSLKR